MVVTFGSPGAEASAAGAAQLNLFHGEDPVGTLVPKLSAAKSRAGTDVMLESDIPLTFFHGLIPNPVAQHAGDAYRDDTFKLVQYAQDSVGPFRLSAFAQSLRTDAVTAIPVPPIAIGNASAAGGGMRTQDGDGYVLGDRGADDSILWQGGQDGATVRLIDGGGHSLGGHDTLLLPRFDVTWNWARNGDHVDLTSGTGTKVAELYRIDDLIFLTGAGLSRLVRSNGTVRSRAMAASAAAAFDPASVLVHLDGRSTTALTAVAGATTLIDDGSRDVVYAGAGVRSVDSAIASRVVVYGRDTTRVTVTGRDSVVQTDGTPSAGIVTIDTGLGDVMVSAGIENDVFVGRLAGATLDGGGGSDSVDFSAVTDALTINMPAGLASSAGDYEYLLNVSQILGSATASNIITAAATGTVMIGGAADDTMIVGAGHDVVSTKGGHDTIRGRLVDFSGDVLQDFTSDDKIEITDSGTVDVLYDNGSGIFQLSTASGQSSLVTIALSSPQAALFVLTLNRAGGNSTIKLIPGTGGSVTAPTAPGGTSTLPSSPTQDSSGAASSQPGTSTSPATTRTIGVFRFFDTTTGTHFLTASAAERASVIATRPDLKDEGVGLTAIDPASGDANAAPIFRFFDTEFGTHFFTASATERDTVITTRSDLVFEKDGIFYEHLTKQAGDIPVFRFFDTVHGTHFYTSSTSEVANITATRLDLKAEGIGFYAPSLS